jgi:hypothetical protein
MICTQISVLCCRYKAKIYQRQGKKISLEEGSNTKFFKPLKTCTE